MIRLVNEQENPSDIHVVADMSPTAALIAPKPRRRGRTYGIRLGILALLLVTGAEITVVMHGAFPQSRTVAATSAASPSPSASVSSSAKEPVPAVPPANLSTVNGMLTIQATALLAGDEKGWMAVVDPKAHAAVAEYKRIFHNMRAMHVAMWQQSSATGNNPTTALEPYSIYVIYCLAVTTCPNTVASLDITAERRGGKVFIEGFTMPKRSSKTDSPLPWIVSDLSAAVGGRVVVAASSAESRWLTTALRDSEAAAKVADRYAEWGKPEVYVIYLADRAEAKTWLGTVASPDSITSYFWVGGDDGETVLYMPQAEDRDAGPGGLTATVQWSLAGVATGNGGGDDGPAFNSLVAGLNEYIDVVGHPTWLSGLLETTRSYVRSGKWPKSTYLTSQFDSSNQTVSAGAQGIGYLTIRRLAQRYGTAKMLDFWGTANRGYDTLDDASETAFGKSWKSVNADCVAYIERTV
jgi:hypothetical protein